MLLALLVVAVAALAFANGANDTFKGVATLYGSGELRYRPALVLATLATLAGSAVSLVLASGLAARFSGKGLLPVELEQSSAALAAIAVAGAGTILLATRLGLPTSTTHALTGALLGVALAAGAGAPALTPLVKLFALPLLLGPLIAILLAWPAAALARRVGRGPGGAAAGDEACLCVAEPAGAPAPSGALAIAAPATLGLVLAPRADCARELPPAAVLATSGGLVRGLHVLSAGAVCFARAVNDTPKIATLLIAAPAVRGSLGLALATVAMALGGWLAARRVADTMSCRITSIGRADGLLGNAVTSLLVLGASPLGLPLSTTHVSCGSILGIALARRQAEGATVRHMLLAWVATLPLAAALASASYALLT